MLQNLCSEKLTVAEAKELIAQLPGADEGGFINYADYITMMSTC